MYHLFSRAMRDPWEALRLRSRGLDVNYGWPHARAAFADVQVGKDFHNTY